MWSDTCALGFCFVVFSDVDSATLGLLPLNNKNTCLICFSAIKVLKNI